MTGAGVSGSGHAMFQGQDSGIIQESFRGRVDSWETAELVGKMLVATALEPRPSMELVLVDCTEFEAHRTCSSVDNVLVDFDMVSIVAIVSTGQEQ